MALSCNPARAHRILAAAPAAAAPADRRESKALPSHLMHDISQFSIEGFAKKYFSTHKKGLLFKKRVPMEQMLVHSKDPINQPLMMLNKSLHKEAIRAFKLLQRVMGDRSGGGGGGSGNDDLQDILNNGINYGELRDEIYCQVCWQLTQNPRIDSVHKGWECMAALVMTFPPSKNFELYLQEVMQAPLTAAAESDVADPRVKLYAQHCLTRLERIFKKGPRGKVPSIAEIERAREAPLKPSVFGESLLEIMRQQRLTDPPSEVPRIIQFLSQAILQLNGQQTEGIFRVPGDADQVTDLRVRLERGQYDVSGIHDASVPASLLKAWLRDLSGPLIPPELYDYCVKNSENAERAMGVLDRVPVEHRNVIEYLIGFLQISSRS